MTPRDIHKIATTIHSQSESPAQTAPRWDVPRDTVMQVIDKLQTGVYAQEEVACPCGILPAHDTEMRRFDRYGIPNRVVLCENCLLFRATPRMTKAALHHFYNTEYRLIYDGFRYGTQMHDQEQMFLRAVGGNAHVIHELLLEFDVHPKTVLEIGCDQGANLWPWMQEGATAYGIDLDESSRAFCESKGITRYASVEEAIAAGVKADLVMASDLIEHLTDLWEVARWKDLLTPGGYLFLYTPGVLANHPHDQFQNAHTYYFIGTVLDYYLRQMGFVPDAQDDRCVYLGRYRGVENIPVILPPQLKWRKYLEEHMTQQEKRSVPPIWTQCKFNESQALDNLKTNLMRGLPPFEPLCGSQQGQEAMILSAGPSIDGQLETIRALQARGVRTLVIDRMYTWATQHGIKADYVVVLDASDDVVEGLDALQPEAVHLLNATGNPAVFDHLKDRTAHIFSGVMGMSQRAVALWREAGYHKLTVVNTGGSVALASMYLALMLGCRRLHIFGFDCMVTDPAKDYSAHVSGVSVPRHYYEIEVGGQTILTCSPFLAFAQQFFDMMETARCWKMIDAVDVYGESLVNHMFESDTHEQKILTTHTAPFRGDS